MYRQGDVLIEGVKEIPAGLKRTSEALLVRGEGRNHGHFILGASLEIFQVDEELNSPDGVITHYLELSQNARLEHHLIDQQMWTKEHEAIEIPSGRYRVIRQREYNPYARAIRLVKD